MIWIESLNGALFLFHSQSNGITFKVFSRCPKQPWTPWQKITFIWSKLRYQSLLWPFAILPICSSWIWIMTIGYSRCTIILTSKSISFRLISVILWWFISFRDSFDDRRISISTRVCSLGRIVLENTQVRRNSSEISTSGQRFVCSRREVQTHPIIRLRQRFARWSLIWFENSNRPSIKEKISISSCRISAFYRSVRYAHISSFLFLHPILR